MRHVKKSARKTAEPDGAGLVRLRMRRRTSPVAMGTATGAAAQFN